MNGGPSSLASLAPQDDGTQFNTTDFAVAALQQYRSRGILA
jgi:hypothetical protein